MGARQPGLSRTGLRGVLALVVSVFASLPASAHPHIFVDMEANIVFDSAGLVEGIHNEWAFDAGYSAWAVEGLDTDNDGQLSADELQALADDNMIGLSEYRYYTFAGEGPDDLSFVSGSNAHMAFVDGRLILSFDVALSAPYRIAKTLEIAINDPEYYVAMTFADASAVTLVNRPSNCSFDMQAPRTMSDALAAQLAALPPDVTALPPDLAAAMRGVQGAILVNCPGGSAPVGTVAPAPPAPSTALRAATELAQTAPPQVHTGNGLPFDGPPPEPGFRLPQTGFLGWVAEQQRKFYRDLNSALQQINGSWTAFWVLCGLSFLYGVFHAAGPGHGKVVIASYVLANEQQVRRGILLSFLSAMLQSAVAVCFVLVAAAVLKLSSAAMNDAAAKIDIFSYGLIALLGVWLIARKLFGWGHAHWPRKDKRHLARRHLQISREQIAYQTHEHDGEPDAYGRLPDDPHYGHDHGDDEEHDHHHDHAHAVTAQQAGGNWLEQLGVVVAVGLRPCSGALIVLALSLADGVLLAGIAAVFAMGLGTALTTGALAALAVSAKGLAGRIAGLDNRATNALLWWAELVAAMVVFGFGLTLVLASL